MTFPGTQEVGLPRSRCLSDPGPCFPLTTASPHRSLWRCCRASPLVWGHCQESRGLVASLSEVLYTRWRHTEMTAMPQ